MSRMGSRSLFGQFRTLFGAGTLSGLGEGALLERFLAQRDEAAFEEILVRHGPMVLGICRRWLDDPHDVEDAFQAVFLILVRKAATLRDRDSLSNWLYGVSLRVAQRARTGAARRRTRERQDAEGLSMAPATGYRPDEREIQVIVDEEIRRLPAKQQAAVVLCLVQGKTHDAAALELSCPLGTVKSRVAGGRATLTRRLTRRGLAPSIVMGARPPFESWMAGTIPQDLLRQTIEAATRLGISRSLRGAAIAPSVESLIEAVSNTMLLARMKSTAVGLATVGVLACAATALVVARQEAPPVHKASAPPVQVVTKDESPAKLDLHGDPLPPGASMRLGTIRHRQDAPIYRIAFTRDAKFVVTDGDDGQLRVWDGQDGKLIRRIDVEIDALSDFALTSDGKTVAATGITLEPRAGWVRHVVFSELATGRQASRGSWVEEVGEIRALALCPDRRLLVTGSSAGQLRLLDTSTGLETGRIMIDNESVDRIELSEDGNRIAVGTERAKNPAGSPRVRVFDITIVSETRVLAKLDINHRGIAFSPDGDAVAVIDGAALVLWRTRSGEQTRYESLFINQAAFSADGERLVGIRTDQFEVWNPIAGQHVGRLNTSSRLTGALALSPDHLTIAANGGPNVLHLWDVASGREKSPATDAHEDRINSVLVTSDGKTLVTASDDQTVRLWNLATGRQQKMLSHRVEVGPIWLSGDGRLLIAGAMRQSCCYVWDMANEAESAVLVEGNSLVSDTLAVSRSDRDQSIVTFGSDGNLHYWNLKDRRIRETISFQFLRGPVAGLPGVAEPFTAAILLAGGQKLATIGRASGLCVVDIQARKEIGRFAHATLLAASPDEKTLAVAIHGDELGLGRTAYSQNRFGNHPNSSTQYHKSGTIVLLDGQTIKEKLRIDVAGSEVWALAFSPDGKTLAATTGWETGQIHVCDVATGREIRTIKTPATRTPALAFSPDGSQIICGMADTSVLVWDLRIPSLRSTGRSDFAAPPR